MVTPNIYATFTSRSGDLFKYVLHPFFKWGAGRAYPGNHFKADAIANTVTAGAFAALTETFAGLEATSFDALCRKAACAELGKRDNEFTFADYYECKNDIIKAYTGLWSYTHKLRLATDMLPIVALGLQYGSKAIPGLRNTKLTPVLEAIEDGFAKHEPKSRGWGGLDYHMVFAGKTGYWIYEVLGIPKGAFYDVYKVYENKEDVKRMVTADDIIGIYNRCRTDCGKPMLDEKYARKAIWPVFEKVAEKVNGSDNFNLDGIVYLIGMNKLNIFKTGADGHEVRDHKGLLMVDEQKLAKAYQEIEMVDKHGLEGIAEMKRQQRLEAEASGQAPKPTHVSRLRRDMLNTQFSFFERVLGKKGTSGELISSRDPAEMGISL